MFSERFGGGGAGLLADLGMFGFAGLKFCCRAGFGVKIGGFADPFLN